MKSVTVFKCSSIDHLGVYQAQVTPLCDTNANEILKDHRYSEGEKGKIVSKSRGVT